MAGGLQFTIYSMQPMDYPPYYPLQGSRFKED